MGKSRVLLIGASGNVGSKVLEEFKKDDGGVTLRLGTSRKDIAENWENEGYEAVVFDLNNPETYFKALKNIDRVFLLTTYSADMLFQSKMFIDASKDAGVSHIVHLGVYSSRRDPIPHFVWHDLIETYLADSGIEWTNIHPNVITDTVFAASPNLIDDKSFTIMSGDAPQGWVCSEDIAAVSATVLKEGPTKHASKDYYLSIEVLKPTEITAILSDLLDTEIVPNFVSIEQQKINFSTIESGPVKSYMDSAVITMGLTIAEKFKAQTSIQDDVLTVIGRPGTTMKQWAMKQFIQSK